MRFAENLVHLRKKLGKKQEEVASELGHTSRSRIANYESGNSKPGFDDLIALADYYKVNIDDLIFKDFSVQENTTRSQDEQPINIAYYQMLINSYEIRINNLEKLNELYSINIAELKTENQNLLTNFKSKVEGLKNPPALESKRKK